MDTLEVLADEKQLRLKVRLIANTQIMHFVCNRLGVFAEEVNEFHYRLTKPGYRMLNVFPQCSKVNPSASNKYEKVYLHEFLLNYFS